MAVRAFNIGTKRVFVTAYCPDDAIGIAACEYILERLDEMLAAGVSPEQFRQYLSEKDPEWAELFALIDKGWKLPYNDRLPVNPSNIHCELRIVGHILKEREDQMKGR
jgi:hypothetical protein